MYAEYLRTCQYHVVESDNASDALALAHTVDAIVIDVPVPGPFDGLELVRQIRSDRRTGNTGILVLSASTLESYRQCAYEAGCDEFVQKPCLPETVARRIRGLLASVFRKQAAELWPTRRDIA
jgi:DNA-binding response OmpR family regulator